MEISVTIEPNGQATFTGIVTFGSNSTTIGDNVINVGTVTTLGHTQGVQFHTQNFFIFDGFEINKCLPLVLLQLFNRSINFMQIFLQELELHLALMIIVLYQKYFTMMQYYQLDSLQLLIILRLQTQAYTRFSDIRIDDNADLIIADGDDFVPDVFGLNEFGTLGGGSGGRMRVDRITDAIDWSSNYRKNGLVVAGVTTFAGSGFSVAEEIYHDGDDNTKMCGLPALIISFEINGSERVRINSSGQMGLGTINPNALIFTSN